MTRRSLLGRDAVRWLALAALGASLLAGCGRSPMVGVDGPDLAPPPTDGWTPPPTDGGIVPERPIPPPPPWDSRPPIPDAVPPPPPTDLWPPPVDGPCVASCFDKCQLLKSCGLIPGGVGYCANQQCPAWPLSQSSCLAALICAPVPGDPCPLAKQCLSNPPPPPPPPLQADLTITGFKAAVSGSTVTYSITTCNQGQGPAGNFFVDVYYDRPAAPGQQEFGDQYNNYGNGLAAGDCVVTTFTRNNTPSGSYTSWAQVDADGIVAETNENNNVSGPVAVTVSATPPPPTGADLVITKLETTIFGSTTISVRYRATICNQGTAAAGPTEVHIYYDQSLAPKQGQAGDKLAPVNGLAPGSCVNRNIYRSGTPQGSYTSWAQVDPYDSVAESNESNNVFGPVKVTVGTAPGADLTIQSFTATLFGSSTVRYHLQVCNSGSGTAGSTEVHVYFNQNAAPKAGVSGDQYTFVTTLQPGSCVNRNIYRSGTPPGSYTSWAQVDPLDLVKETNESNNVAGPVKVTVGSTPPPPPPPSPCNTLCNFVVNTCNLLPSSQYSTCVSICGGLPPDKIQCAQNAMSQGQCSQIVSCLF